MNETVKIFLEFITAFVGTFAFALVFRIRYKHLLVVAVGGTLTYLVYKLAILAALPVLASAFLSALFMGLFSEISARSLRAPVAVFLLPCAIPIVPGSSLYYTMESLLTHNTEDLRFHLSTTAEVAIGIAVGTSVAAICVSIFFYIREKTLSKIKKQ